MAETDVPVSNADVARVFTHVAELLELDEANPFRVRAYREAARVIESLTESLAALEQREEGLTGIRGIGKDLAGKIHDILTTGTTQVYEDVKGKFPPGLPALTLLQGLGPKRVRTLWQTLGVTDRAGLEKAAREGKLKDLPGFGEKMEQKVLHSLAVAASWGDRMMLATAWPVAEELVARLGRCKGVEQVEAAGSFRRRRDTVGDLDLVVTGGRVDAVMDTLVKHPHVAEVLGRGDTKSSVRLASGLQVDLRLVPAESFGAALLYFTGSKAHNIELRRIALDKGLSLNEYGLWKGKQQVAGRTEEEIYRALGMPWIPPELREHQGEIALALERKLPKLVELDDIVADLHMHTTRSDGKNTIREMVEACKARGYAYCAITEHSKSLAMARGFDEKRVRKSVDEIAEVRRQVKGIEVLHGLEVDILADGSLDLDDDALALLDWVIVSLHSRLDMPREAMTKRVLRALDHPAVCVMGHPTGRLIGTRPAADFDCDKVFARAGANGVAMEINAQPDRVDLNDQNARNARGHGVRFVIETDAHSIPQLDAMRWGIFAARRAGLTRTDVLNSLPWARFREAIHHRKRGAAASPAGRAAEPELLAGSMPSAEPKPPAGSGRRAAGPARRATEPEPSAGPARRKAAGARAATKQRAPAKGRPARAARGKKP